MNELPVRMALHMAAGHSHWAHTLARLACSMIFRTARQDYLLAIEDMSALISSDNDQTAS